MYWEFSFLASSQMMPVLLVLSGEILAIIVSEVLLHLSAPLSSQQPQDIVKPKVFILPPTQVLSYLRPVQRQPVLLRLLLGRV